MFLALAAPDSKDVPDYEGVELAFCTAQRNRLLQARPSFDACSCREDKRARWRCMSVL